MIQRIQTIYFLLIAILGSCTFFFPVANLYSNTETTFILLNYKGFNLVEVFDKTQELIINTRSLSILSALIPVLAIVAIFLYKKRILQMRLSFINIFLMLGYYIVLFIYLWQASKQWNLDFSLYITAAFPLVNIILSWLAIRAIGKDEALVKSLNRLR